MDKYDIDRHFIRNYERLSRKEARGGWLTVVFIIVIKLGYFWGANARLSLPWLSILIAFSVWGIVLLRKKSSSIPMRFLFIGSCFCIWSIFLLSMFFMILSYHTSADPLISYRNSILWSVIAVLLVIICIAIVIVLTRRSVISDCVNKDEIYVPSRKGYYAASIFTFSGALGIAFARNLLANVSETESVFLLLAAMSFGGVVFSAITGMFYYKAYLIIRYCTHKFLRLWL